MVGNPIGRKCLAVGIILLLTGAGIIPTTAQNGEKPSLSTSSGHWLYVGGSGPGNYTKIQDAIDNASDGDTVYVYSGMYGDYITDTCIEINKSLSLIGQDKATTIINGSGHYESVRIEGTKITLSGFTIRNDGLPQYVRVGIIIDYPSQDIDIHDMIITQNYYGIQIGGFSDSFLINNISIYENSIVENNYGIENIWGNSNIQIHHNMISQNGCGIQGVYNYTISKNHISNNTVGISEGAGSINVIHNNDIRDNDIGLRIYQVRGSEISENNFINNQKHTYVARIGMLLAAPFQVLLKQKWRDNYFDDWIKKIPRPIVGHESLYIWFWIPPGLPFQLRIAVLLYLEFDWHPAQEPYDIPQFT